MKALTFRIALCIVNAFNSTVLCNKVTQCIKLDLTSVVNHKRAVFADENVRSTSLYFVCVKTKLLAAIFKYANGTLSNVNVVNFLCTCRSWRRIYLLVCVHVVLGGS